MNCTDNFSIPDSVICLENEDKKLFVLIGAFGASSISIPTLLLSVFILSILLKNKDGNQPLDLVLISLIITSVFLVLAFFLFDFSLTTNYPTLGRCLLLEHTLKSSLIRALSNQSQIFLLLLSIVFFGNTRFICSSCCRVKVVKVVITIIVMFTTGQEVVLGALFYYSNSEVLAIQGSFCFVEYDKIVIPLLILAMNILLFLLPLFLSSLFIAITCFKVFVAVFELDKRVVCLTLAYLSAIVVGTCISKVPEIALQIVLLNKNVSQSTAVRWMLIGTIVLQMRTLVMLCLMFAIHKKVKKSFVNMVIKICRYIFCKCSVKVSYTITLRPEMQLSQTEKNLNNPVTKITSNSTL